MRLLSFLLKLATTGYKARTGGVPMQASNIDDVIAILDGMVADCMAKGDPIGYLPALYRCVTLQVKKGIEDGAFDDSARMASFDAIFADRYFAAYDAFRSGGELTKSWELAFSATASGKLIILRDLLVAINAHINLDLGVAAGTTYQGADLHAFHGDFDRINKILAALIPPVEKAVGEFPPLLHLLEDIGGKDAVEVLDFSLDAARDDAWLHACLIADLPPEKRPDLIAALDSKVSFLGKVVAQPGGIVGKVVDLIRDTESRDVPAIIKALSELA
jgi:hypothetical protein